MNEQFIQRLSIDWNKIEQNSYLRKIEAIKDLDELVFDKPITFFVGENGSGKSTLLEAIAVASGFNPEGGTRKVSRKIPRGELSCTGTKPVKTQWIIFI